MRITWRDYMKGRDECYRDECTVYVMRNAQHTIEVINAVLAAMEDDSVDLTGVHVPSGWRPHAVNDATANAAAHSPHLDANAGDVGDLPDRRLARWCLANPAKLKACGVAAMERPAWTPSWVHWQTVPVASGRFFFVPSKAQALVAALPGELEVCVRETV